MIGRRGFITGLVSFVAAPAIVRAGSLMPVKVMVEAPNLTATEILGRYADFHMGRGPWVQQWEVMQTYVLGDLIKIEGVAYESMMVGPMTAAFNVLASIILVAAVMFILRGHPAIGLIVALIGCGLCVGEIHIRDRT